MVPDSRLKLSSGVQKIEFHISGQFPHYRAEVLLSFITTTVWDESQVTPQGHYNLSSITGIDRLDRWYKKEIRLPLSLKLC